MAASFTITPVTLPSALPRTELRAGNSWSPNFSATSQLMPMMRKERPGRRVWRRRKLVKKDEYLHQKMERVPFLEEQVRKIRDEGSLMAMDIERLLLSEDNRFEFVNEIADEANAYVESNRDEYGGTKKAILHVLTNRVNDAGFYRPEAYYEPDPFKPPNHRREEFT